MAKQHLTGVRVAILAADGFEQLELTRPRKALLDHGASVEVISLRPGSIRGINALYPGSKVKVDRTIYTARAKSYDALLIPGGFVNPDLLRQSKRVLDFVREFDRAGKPIASLCHGPWVLISAGLVSGRRLTSWPGIKDDVRNADGIWENHSVVKDGNWITSRGPHDLLQFNRAMVRHFSPALEATERRSAIPFGRIALGGLAIAALGYGLRQLEGGEQPPRQ
jgi:protease I